MTYQQYYNKLIKELDHSEKNIRKQHKLLKGEKGYMDKKDMFIYMGLFHDLNTLVARCEEVLKLMTGRDVSPGDEINPAKLSGPIDI